MRRNQEQDIGIINTIVIQAFRRTDREHGEAALKKLSWIEFVHLYAIDVAIKFPETEGFLYLPPAKIPPEIGRVSSRWMQKDRHWNH